MKTYEEKSNDFEKALLEASDLFLKRICDMGYYKNSINPTEMASLFLECACAFAGGCLRTIEQTTLLDINKLFIFLIDALSKDLGLSVIKADSIEDAIDIANEMGNDNQKDSKKQTLH
jgi:hypothetical protein